MLANPDEARGEEPGAKSRRELTNALLLALAGTFAACGGGGGDPGFTQDEGEIGTKVDGSLFIADAHRSVEDDGAPVNHHPGPVARDRDLAPGSAEVGLRARRTQLDPRAQGLGHAHQLDVSTTPELHDGKVGDRRSGARQGQQQPGEQAREAHRCRLF